LDKKCIIRNSAGLSDDTIFLGEPTLKGNEEIVYKLKGTTVRDSQEKNIQTP